MAALHHRATSRLYPFPHFQQFLHVRRSNGFCHLAAPLALGRPTGQHLHLLGTTQLATMRGLYVLRRLQGRKSVQQAGKSLARTFDVTPLLLSTHHIAR